MHGSDVGVPPPGDHGGDAARIATALGVDRADLLDLSASLNPVAPDVSALAVRHLEALGHYPHDGAATGLLASALDVDPDRLVLTNGGAEAIALVAAERERGEVVDPEFSLYRRHLAAVEPGTGRWRSDPSNPLGELAGPDATAAVWDEAFYPLATGQWTAAGRESVWRLGSLTKLWACPGLRLGYVLAPDGAAARRIRARRPRWTVNGLALALVPDLLDRTDLPAWCRAVAGLRAELTGGLEAAGYTVHPSAANWVLVRPPPAPGDASSGEVLSGVAPSGSVLAGSVPAGSLRTELARRHIVVRDCASFGLSGWYRVAVPPRSVLDRVVVAFTAALDGAPYSAASPGPGRSTGGQAGDRPR